jgi:predicted extracellular nuclease
LKREITLVKENIMSATSLRLMSINLENLFEPGISFYNRTYTQDEFDNKIQWISDLIIQAQVHVVAVLELGENPDSCLNIIMEEVNNTSILGNMPFSYHYAGSPSVTGAPIRTGIISRFPLTNSSSISDYPQDFSVDLFNVVTQQWMTVPSYRFSRPVTRVTVNPPNNANPFNVFVVHFKSKRPNKSEHDDNNEAIGIARSAIQRNIEAAALRYYLDTFLPTQYETDNKVATFVAGDFNDTPSSVPLENVRGPFDKVPGPASPWSEPDKRRLLNCARLHLKFTAHEDKLYSYVHNENFSLIDNIFVTEHLAKRFVRMEVYNDHVFRHEDLSETTEEDQQWKSQVSDHGVMVVEFTRMLRTGN